MSNKADQSPLRLQEVWRPSVRSALTTIYCEVVYFIHKESPTASYTDMDTDDLPHHPMKKEHYSTYRMHADYQTKAKPKALLRATHSSQKDFFNL